MGGYLFVGLFTEKESPQEVINFVLGVSSAEG
jgi:hypothetical protein